MDIRRTAPSILLVPGFFAVLMVVLLTACAAGPAPVIRPEPPPPPGSEATTSPLRPPPLAAPVAEPAPVVPPEPIPEDTLGSRSLDELNRDSPLQVLFFNYDSAVIDAEGRGRLQANANLLKRYPNWVLTIEGHCDERGTAEYNLGLGERRALEARNYLLQLGIGAQRLRTVSYGKEFPFDPGHNEAAWANNRRAHFVITAK